MLPKRSSMTRGSIKEYSEAMRNRYIGAGKKEKGRILDEFVQVTGYHRKASIRKLKGTKKSYPSQCRGRPREYGWEVTEALAKVWEASDRLCSKRLHPFLPELTRVLRRYGEMVISDEVEDQLYRMSPATIDRLLRPRRGVGRARSFSTTKPGSLLKQSIPIRTFGDWEENQPGFLEVDLVSHCGESGEGFFLTTLCAVDVSSGWSECVGVWGKGQVRVGSAIHQMRQRLPFALMGLDSDNGGEFINHHLYEYCRREGIVFTRSRSYKKNDSCHVEQKNWSIVRRLIGYDRYSSRKALEALNRVYNLLRLYVNFFQPVMKLVSKTRNGAKVRKVYDVARTPYQRLVGSGVLTQVQKQELAAIYHGLNPIAMLNEIDQNLEQLWAQADRPTPQARGKKLYTNR